MSDSSEEVQILDPEEDNYAILNRYEELKETNISRPLLSKYEKTKILSERTQQLSNGSVSFLKNPKSYSNLYEIALEELRQKKLPFLIRRPVANRYEYWKLSDLVIL